MHKFSPNETIADNPFNGTAIYTIPMGDGYEVSIIHASEHLFEAILFDGSQNTVLRCSYVQAHTAYEFVRVSEQYVHELRVGAIPVRMIR